MSYQLLFKKSFFYDSTQTGITIPISLSLLGKQVLLNAKIDTGASCCIFERKYAQALDIEIESGIAQIISTATGTFNAYGHDVTMSVLDYDFDTTIYFAALENFNRNVLGRMGWLDRVKLGIIDYDSILYLSHYNDD